MRIFCEPSSCARDVLQLASSTRFRKVWGEGTELPKETVNVVTLEWAGVGWGAVRRRSLQLFPSLWLQNRRTPGWADMPRCSPNCFPSSASVSLTGPCVENAGNKVTGGKFTLGLETERTSTLVTECISCVGNRSAIYTFPLNQFNKLGLLLPQLCLGCLLNALTL